LQSKEALAQQAKNVKISGFKILSDNAKNLRAFYSGNSKRNRTPFSGQQ